MYNDNADGRKAEDWLADEDKYCQTIMIIPYIDLFLCDTHVNVLWVEIT